MSSEPNWVVTDEMFIKFILFMSRFSHRMILSLTQTSHLIWEQTCSKLVLRNRRKPQTGQQKVFLCKYKVSTNVGSSLQPPNKAGRPLMIGLPELF